jgi:hypothetical protein
MLVNDYFLVVRASVRLLPGGVRSCTTTSEGRPWDNTASILPASN